MRRSIGSALWATPSLDNRPGTILPAILLGVGATLLTLFIEFRLLQATDVRPGGHGFARVQELTTYATLRGSHGADAGQPHLQVKARQIDVDNRISRIAIPE